MNEYLPITNKQIYRIKNIEHNLGIKFRGKAREEAQWFIKRFWRHSFVPRAERRARRASVNG